MTAWKSGRARSPRSNASRTTSPKSATASNCGIDLAGHKDIRVGDIIETYTTEQLADELGRNAAEVRKEVKAEKDRLAAVAAAEAANPAGDAASA